MDIICLEHALLDLVGRREPCRTPCSKFSSDKFVGLYAVVRLPDNHDYFQLSCLCVDGMLATREPIPSVSQSHDGLQSHGRSAYREEVVIEEEYDRCGNDGTMSCEVV